MWRWWVVYLQMGLWCLSPGDAAEGQREPEQWEGDVALICAEEISDPEALKHRRAEHYLHPGLRALRGIHRHTGVDLGAGGGRLLNLSRWTLQGLAFAGLLLVWRLRHKKPLRAGVCFAASMLAGTGGWGMVQIQVAVRAIDAWDRSGGLARQSLIDIALSRGWKLKVYGDFHEFEKAWNHGAAKNVLPFRAILWGLSKPDDRARVWLDQNMDLPAVQVGIGPHLPTALMSCVFGLDTPALDWDEGAPSRLTDPASRISRSASYAIPGTSSPGSGIYPRGRGRVVYAPATVAPEKLAELIDIAQRQVGGAAYAEAALEGCVALRLDDPGSAQNIYLESWAHPEVSAEQWREVDDILERHRAKLTIGYVPGWLDDGDGRRGELYVDGDKVEEREPGKVYPSHRVDYFQKSTGTWYRIREQVDYFRQARQLEFELHGHTHIDADVTAWLAAADRFEKAGWYREFRSVSRHPHRDRPAAEQEVLLDRSLALYREVFGRDPTVLVPPGHQISANTPAICVQKGLDMLSADHLRIRVDGRMLACRSICGVDLRRVGAAGMPAPEKGCSVGILHARDIAELGPGWLDTLLAGLKNRGLEHVISLRQLYDRMTGLPRVRWTPGQAQLELTFEKVVVREQVLDFWLVLPQGWELMLLPHGLERIGEDTMGQRILLRRSIAEAGEELHYTLRCRPIS